LGCLLYIFETYVFAHYHQTSAIPQETSLVMKELAESTQGLYLIFIPFVPCLLWSLMLQNQQSCDLQKQNTLHKKQHCD
jgi:hypothetical protein